MEDATVSAGEQGVTLSLQNIQFAPNSAQLRASEQAKLRQIGEILQNYPDRDILITGHTARVPGYTEKDHQQARPARRCGGGFSALTGRGSGDPGHHPGYGASGAPGR